MLAMALLATGHVGVEGRWLPLQKTGIVRMTNDAATGLYALNGGMTSSTVMFKEGMCLREWSWTGHALPRHRTDHTRTNSAWMASEKIK